MNNPSNSTRVRIYNYLTQSRFLHIEDSLVINKVRLFAGTYRKSKGMSTYANAFVNIADARVIFGALARGEQGFRHKEYKGTPPRNGKAAVSRVLSVAVKGENVYVELKTGPGKLTNTGAITPNGKATTEVNVGFKLYEARRMAAEVLAYIHAWDVMRMMYHHGVAGNQNMVSKPSSYTLVSATSVSNSIRTAPANGVSKPNGAARPPVVANNGRPVTRKTAPNTNGRSQNGHAKQNGNGSQPQVLLYGDGTPVAADNQTERSTYVRYRQAKSAVPPSKSALQQFYQQQMAA
ncbi:MAG: hypothetical protein HF973_18340 [Chloroflexi bacterium]|nr:hypothetical protein [Chloroflexota bacterium]